MWDDLETPSGSMKVTNTGAFQHVIGEPRLNRRTPREALRAMKLEELPHGTFSDIAVIRRGKCTGAVFRHVPFTTDL